MPSYERDPCWAGQIGGRKSKTAAGFDSRLVRNIVTTESLLNDAIDYNPRCQAFTLLSLNMLGCGRPILGRMNSPVCHAQRVIKSCTVPTIVTNSATAHPVRLPA